MISVIETRNLTNPVIVGKINSSNIAFTYQIAITSDRFYLPSYQSYYLYYGKAFFYGSLNTANYNGQKFFIIDLVGVDPITMDKSVETYSILDVKIPNEEWPYWLQQNLITRTLVAKPSEFSDLLSLRSFQITFGTQISFKELTTAAPGKNSSDIENMLLIENAINEQRIPLKYLTNPLAIDPSFSPNNLMTLLNSHYFTQTINFITDDFLEFNTPPAVTSFSLETQINQYGTIKLYSEFNFQIDDNTFIDLDGDPLIYSVENLPSWLVFFSNTKKFVGTPHKEDIGIYFIGVTVSDGFSDTSDFLRISIIKNKPIAIPFNNQKLVLGKTWLFEISIDSFIDLDGSLLTYNASIINNNGTEEKLPLWMNFDSAGLRLYGTPKTIDIVYDSSTRMYYQEFLIKVMAIDIADQTVGLTFTLTVINNSPKINTINTVTIQFSKIYPTYLKIGTNIDFEISANTFFDEDEDFLTYDVIGLPSWLSYNNRKISGTCPKTGLGNYTIKLQCSDGFSQSDDSFGLQIINHAPKALPLKNHTFVLGGSLYLSISKSTFFDDDSDTLSYSAAIISENGSRVALPNWLNFDDSRLLFTGSPLPSLISQNKTTNQYYQVFSIEFEVKDIADETNVTSFHLIVMNFPPKVNASFSLQKQFGNIQPIINTATEFKFDSSAFIDENNGTLTFISRLAGSNGGRRLLSNSSNIQDSTSVLPDWIKFDSYQQKFSINPPESEVNKNYKVVVIASNGLQNCTDSYSFTVGYSYLYILDYLIKIISPMLAIYGFFAYKILLYNIFFKSFYNYSKVERIMINQNYQKNIYLINDDIDKGWLLWEEIQKRNVDKKSDWTKCLESNEFLIDSLQEVKNNIQNFYIKPEELESDASLFIIVKGFMIHQAMKEYPRSLEIFKKLKKRSEKALDKSWYLDYVELGETPEITIKKSGFVSLEFKAENSLDSSIKDLQAQLAKRKKINCCKRSESEVFDENTVSKEKLLVKEMIKIYAWGIPPKPTGWFRFYEYSRGESIFAQSQDIAEIQVLKKKEVASRISKKIEKYLAKKQNHHSLPHFLNYKVKNSVLIFKGTPSEKHVGQYIVRIFNRLGYVMREFEIKIVSERMDSESLNTPPDSYAKKGKERASTMMKETMVETATSLFQHEIDPFHHEHEVSSPTYFFKDPDSGKKNDRKSTIEHNSKEKIKSFKKTMVESIQEAQLENNKDSKKHNKIRKIKSIAFYLEEKKI